MKQEDIDRILQLVAYVKLMCHSPWGGTLNTLGKARELLPGIVDSLRWRPAYPGITYRWTAGAACFVCPCGTEHAMDEDGETVTCSCGTTYRLRHYVEVDRVMAGVPPDDVRIFHARVDGTNWKNSLEERS